MLYPANFYRSIVIVYDMQKSTFLTQLFFADFLIKIPTENFTEKWRYFSLLHLNNLVWHSRNFLLPCNIVEEYFIISTTYIFNLYFQCFVVGQLSAFTFIVFHFFILAFIFCLKETTFIWFPTLNYSLPYPDNTMGNETDISDN